MSSTPTIAAVFTCVRNLGALRLAPLLPAGLLLAIAGLVAALVFGWQSTSPLLAPGAVYRDGSRDLQIVYAPPTSAGDAVTLVVRDGDRETAITPRAHGDYPIGAATLRVDAFRPGLWVTASGAEPALRGEAVIAAGVACETPGGEESLLVPAFGAGLRIICAEDAAAFRVELYQSESVEPVFAAEVRNGEQLTIPLSDAHGLELMAVPALTLHLSSLPQLWLAWLGIAVALVGLTGRFRPNAYALVQVMQTGAAASTVMVHADSPLTAAALVNHVAAAAVPTEVMESSEPAV